MQVVTDPNRKLPAQTTITDAEALQLFQTMNAFAGSYKTEGDKLIWRREIDARGSFVGTEQVRFFEVNGDRLQYHSVPFVSSFDGKQIVSNSGLGSSEIKLMERRAKPRARIGTHQQPCVSCSMLALMSTPSC